MTITLGIHKGFFQIFLSVSLKKVLLNIDVQPLEAARGVVRKVLWHSTERDPAQMLLQKHTTISVQNRVSRACPDPLPTFAVNPFAIASCKTHSFKSALQHHKRVSLTRYFPTFSLHIFT